MRSLYRFNWTPPCVLACGAKEVAMESLILASYVLKTREQNAGRHPALDERFQESAQNTLSSLAASLAGIGVFIFVLSLLG